MTLQMIQPAKEMSSRRRRLVAGVSGVAGFCIDEHQSTPFSTHDLDRILMMLRPLTHRATALASGFGPGRLAEHGLHLRCDQTSNISVPGAALASNRRSVKASFQMVMFRSGRSASPASQWHPLLATTFSMSKEIMRPSDQSAT
nr:hypothetical protein CFP56_67348 [Quercus suber]